jgi:hypothetical protein
MKLIDHLQISATRVKVEMHLLGTESHGGQVQRVVCVTGDGRCSSILGQSGHLVLAGTNVGSLLDVGRNGLSELAQRLDDLSRSVLEEDLALDLGDSGVKVDTLVERDWAGEGRAREGESRRECGEGRHGGCAGSE